MSFRFRKRFTRKCAGSGVKVSALCPGPTRTEFGEVAGFTNKERLRPVLDGRRYGGSRRAEALDRNKAVAVTGILNKVGAFSTRLVPRALVRKIAGALKF
jgi:uncharacterized protein